MFNYMLWCRVKKGEGEETRWRARPESRRSGTLVRCFRRSSFQHRSRWPPCLIFFSFTSGIRTGTRARFSRRSIWQRLSVIRHISLKQIAKLVLLFSLPLKKNGKKKSKYISYWCSRTGSTCILWRSRRLQKNSPHMRTFHMENLRLSMWRILTFFMLKKIEKKTKNIVTKQM